jgi:hypothetical protein
MAACLRPEDDGLLRKSATPAAVGVARGGIGLRPDQRRNAPQMFAL